MLVLIIVSVMCVYIIRREAQRLKEVNEKIKRHDDL